MAVKADITIDIDKQIGELQNLSQVYNARVGDDKTPLTIAWRKNDLPLNLKGLHAFIVGKTGDGSYNNETGKIDFPVGSPVSQFEDDGSGTLDGGQSGLTTLLIPKQMWQKSGIFAGYIGLKSEDGSVFTSKDIWFKVLGNVLDAGVEINYFIGDFNKALAEAEKKLQDKEANFDKTTANALQDLHDKYLQKVQQAEDGLNKTNAAIDEDIAAFKKIVAEITSLQAKLETEDVITISQYQKDMTENKNAIQSKLADISTNIEGFPTADDLKNTYPQGKNGIFMAMDTGHGFVWWNNGWTDCGQLMTMRDTGQAVYKPYVDHLPLKDHPDSENHPGDASWWTFNKIYPAGYVSYVSLEITGDDDQKAIVGLVDKDTNKVMALEEANGHGKLIINFNKVMENSFYILIKATNFKFTNEENGIDYTVWLIKDGDTGYDYVHLGQPMNPNWQKGNYTPYLDVAYISISDQLNKLRDSQFQGSNSSELDFNKYLSKGGYLFGVDVSSTDKLQHAPNGDTWGYYSLIVLPISPSFYVQIATAYQAEHGKCFAIRYVGKNDDGTFNTSNPPLNEWIIIYHENLSHNKMFIAGDSITAGHPYEDNTHIAYANEISRSLKFEVTRGARNGSGWFYQKGGVSGQTIVDSTDFGQYNVALFAFGTNDFGNDQELGKLGDMYPNQKTFYGVVDYCVNKIYQSNPHITLILSTPLIRVDYGDASTKYALKTKNKAGYTLDQYIQAEIDICQKYNISYIDNRISPFNVLSAPNLLVDQLHPNEEGYHILGSYLASKVSAIIKPYVE